MTQNTKYQTVFDDFKSRKLRLYRFKDLGFMENGIIVRAKNTLFWRFRTFQCTTCNELGNIMHIVSDLGFMGYRCNYIFDDCCFCKKKLWSLKTRRKKVGWILRLVPNARNVRIFLWFKRYLCKISNPLGMLLDRDKTWSSFTTIPVNKNSLNKNETLIFRTIL